MGGGFTWHAIFAAIQWPLTAINSRGRALSAPITGASGPATFISPTQRRAGLITSERELLASEARTARRQHRAVKHLHMRAYSITCEILARGVR